MNTVLRLYFNPVDQIFPDDYHGQEFIEITGLDYIPQTGCQVYFDTAKYIDDAVIAGRIDALMDQEGFKVNIWRVDYLEPNTIISASLTSSANLAA